jgi:hypothetical protein
MGGAGDNATTKLTAFEFSHLLQKRYTRYGSCGVGKTR